MVASVKRRRPVFVAPSEDWTIRQTAEAFAARERAELTADGRGGFALAGRSARYRVTLIRTRDGWVFAVVADDG